MVKGKLDTLFTVIGEVNTGTCSFFKDHRVWDAYAWHGVSRAPQHCCRRYNIKTQTVKLASSLSSLIWWNHMRWYKSLKRIWGSVGERHVDQVLTVSTSMLGGRRYQRTIQTEHRSRDIAYVANVSLAKQAVRMIWGWAELVSTARELKK